MMRRIAVILFGAAIFANAQLQPAPVYRYFRVGSSAAIAVHPRAGYALMGGGTDQDAAFQWLCGHANGGDFLVLRATGTDAYNPYIQGLCHVNSVATLIIPDRAAAGDPFVAATITHAAAIFIAGGDQANYIRNWSGSPVESALRDAVKRGVPVGGTSAGLAVLGQYIYSAQNDKADGPDLTSDVALKDPFTPQVVIAPDLLGIPILRGIITDSHFDTRHREGRLLVFMARILASGKTDRIRGIGIDEKTALLLEPNGQGKVVGHGSVSFYQGQHQAKICRPGQPLTFGPVRQFHVSSGDSVDLRKWDNRISAVEIMVKNGVAGTAIQVD